MVQEQKIETVRDILYFNAARYGIRNAVQQSDGSFISYKELLRSVNHLGTALCQVLSLENKTVALCGKNCYRWCLSYLAVSCGVGVLVPLDREMDGEQLWSAISFAGCKAILCDAAVCKKLIDSKKRLPHGVKIICFEETPYKNAISFEKLLGEGKALYDSGNAAFTKKQLRPEVASFFLFTSGTTGNAKVVMLSHQNLISDIVGVMNRIELDCNDSTLCLLPLHHTYQAIVMLAMFYVGGTVSFGESLRRMSKQLCEFKPTVFVAVPLILEKLHTKITKKLAEQSGIKRILTQGKMSQVLKRHTSPEGKKRIYSIVHEAFGGKLRMIVCGAAALNPAIAVDFQSFGIPVIIGYGLTECSPIVICNSFFDPQPDSIGKPLDNCKVIVADQDENGIGEICVQGPMVMVGYYKNKKATAKVKEGGVFHTGDLGYCDKNGFYHITGRSKNVIVTKGGKNIYPEELEFYLNNNPVVLESLIFSDEKNGEEQVVAHVVPDEDAIKEKLQKEKLSREDVKGAIYDVVKAINKRLPAYKIIRKVKIRDKEFEKTSTDKIKRDQEQNE